MLAGRGFDMGKDGLGEMFGGGANCSETNFWVRPISVPAGSLEACN